MESSLRTLCALALLGLPAIAAHADGELSGRPDAQGLGTIRTGRNREGYRWGNRGDLSGWLAYPWTRWLGTSARAGWSWWDNITGDDDVLNPAMVPTADPDRRGGHRLELWAGVNLYLPLGPLGRHRFAVEAGFPAYEWLDGPQLETDWRIVVGWQKAFHGLGAGGGQPEASGSHARGRRPRKAKSLSFSSS